MTARTTSVVTVLAIGFMLQLAAQQMGQRRSLLVSVIDRDGSAVSALAAENFRGQFRGQPVTILSAALDAAPQRIALVVDSSASMDRHWEFARAMAEDVVFGLTSDHSLTVFTVGQTLEQHLSPSRHPSVLLRALSLGMASEPDGPSALYDGLVEVMEERSGVQRSDVVYLISDGEDTRSRRDVRYVKTLGTKNGVRVFSALLGTGPSRRQRPVNLLDPPQSAWQSDQFRFPDGDLKDIADATGGLSLRVGQNRAADDALNQQVFLAAITQAYRLEVEFAEEIDRAREWDLEVIDAGGKELNGVRVAYARLVVPR